MGNAGPSLYCDESGLTQPQGEHKNMKRQTANKKDKIKINFDFDLSFKHVGNPFKKALRKLS